ncbi:MAG: response regulator [Thermoleophilia bacterium]
MSASPPPPGIHADDLPATTLALPDEVWARIRARVEVTLAEVEGAATRLFDAPLTPALLATAEDHARALSEWLSHLGIGAGATFVRQMADALHTPNAGPAQAVRVAALAEDVRSAMSTVPVALAPAVRDAPLVAVYGTATSDVDALLWNCVVQGLRTEHHGLGGVAVHEEDPPTAIAVVGDADACAPQLRLLRERHPRTPLLAVVEGLHDGGRLDLRRLADTVVGAPADPALVGMELRRAIRRSTLRPAVGLLGCGESPLGPALRERGVHVTDLAAPGDVAPLVRAGTIDTVVVGHDVSTRAVTALLQVVRADPDTRDCIVVVLDSEIARARRGELFRLGADALVDADGDVSELLSQLRGMLGRTHGAPPDPSQGRRVLPWSGGRLFLERLLEAAQRDDRASSLAMITLPAGADPRVLDAIQDELATEFRTEDVVTRLDARRQVVALQGVNRRTAIRRLEVVIQGSRLGTAGARAGVAEFPFDGRSVDELLRVAEASVTRAHEASGPVSVGADWMREADGTVEVLIVAADEALTEVLISQLRERGISGMAMHDGVDALDWLVHERRGLPRTIVLEFDVPGLSGLQLLRRLRETGLMNRFRVMMMAGQTRESDVRTAFELGAAEIISKPFQSVVFVNRLRRLLDA